MKCPKCGGEAPTRNSRRLRDGRMYRLRRCAECGFTFGSYEGNKEGNKTESPVTKVYVKYSAKYPYLPVAVADSKAELAEMLGVSRNNVDTSFSHKIKTFKEVYIGRGE